MGTRLAKRRAVVTGAADGMGKAIARLFAAEGAHVLAVDIQRDGLAEFADDPAITTMVQDLGDPQAADRIVSRASEELGGLDILINNAGVKGERRPLQAETDENWDHVLNINLDVIFRLSRAASAPLIESSCGRIINISSIQGKLGSPTAGSYVVSKHGVIGLTRSFALDLGPHGITVNCIMPGFITTGLTRTLEADNPAVYDRVMSKVVVGRPGQPIDIAGLALFLAGTESGFMTGTCIPVDGGATCW